MKTTSHSKSTHYQFVLDFFYIQFLLEHNIFFSWKSLVGNPKNLVNFKLEKINYFITVSRKKNQVQSVQTRKKNQVHQKLDFFLSNLQ